jgi:hypothetical protein
MQRRGQEHRILYQLQASRRLVHPTIRLVTLLAKTKAR